MLAPSIRVALLFFCAIEVFRKPMKPRDQLLIRVRSVGNGLVEHVATADLIMGTGGGLLKNRIETGYNMKRSAAMTMHLSLLGFVLLSGCTGNVRQAAPGEDRAIAKEDARDDVRRIADDTLLKLYAEQPSARRVVENAAGYAVFSNFGLKILVAGGGTGKGLAVNNATKHEIFMRMAEVQAGLGFGVKKFRLVWVFDTPGTFNAFVDKGYQFGGQATLTAQLSGKGAGYAGAMSVSPGVWVYQITDDGIAAELTAKGTKYYRDQDLN